MHGWSAGGSVSSHPPPPNWIFQSELNPAQWTDREDGRGAHNACVDKHWEASQLNKLKSKLDREQERSCQVPRERRVPFPRWHGRRCTSNGEGGKETKAQNKIHRPISLTYGLIRWAQPSPVEGPANPFLRPPVNGSITEPVVFSFH